MKQAIDLFTADPLQALLQPDARTVLIVTGPSSVLTGAMQWRFHKRDGVLLYACTSQSAMVLLRQCRPQALVLDEHLDEPDSQWLIARVRDWDRQTRIIRRRGDAWVRCDIEVSSQPAGEGLMAPGVSGAPQLRLVPGLSLAPAAKAPPQSFDEPAMVGESLPMRRLKTALCELRDAWLSQPSGPVPVVLIKGERGTGKQLAARTLHRMLGPDAGHFMAVDCSSMPADFLALALRGRAAACPPGVTLFLDELGELDPSNQAVLRRFLGEGGHTEPLGMPGSGGLRLMVASCHALEKLLQEGRLDSGLYRSLVLVRGIAIPPLRDRAGDVSMLARHFAAQIGSHYGKPGMRVSEPALVALEQRGWPDNVRALRNAIEEAVILESGPLLDNLSA